MNDRFNFLLELVDRYCSGDVTRSNLEAQLRAAIAAQQGAPVPQGWSPMETAPLDGTLVRLLVRFDHNSIEDTSDPTVTIGSHNDGEWNFVGWCWHTDEWARGSGDLIGWLPLTPSLLAPRQSAPDTPPMCEPPRFFELLRELADTGHISGMGVTSEAMTRVRAALSASPQAPAQRDEGTP